MKAKSIKDKLEAIKKEHRFSDYQLAQYIGISKTTLYKRINNDDWSPMEEHWIDHLWIKTLDVFVGNR